MPILVHPNSITFAHASVLQILWSKWVIWISPGDTTNASQGKTDDGPAIF